MRHRKKFNHLSRPRGHRKAMLANLTISLIEHKRITTSLPKAKALQSYIEPLLTRSKEDTTHNRRIIFKYLQNKQAIKELFREVAEKIADRPGGYTRVLKTGFRKGDNTPMAIIELVDFNEMYQPNEGKKEAGTKKKRTRRAGGTAAQTETATAVQTDAQENPQDVSEKEQTPQPEETPKQEETPKAEQTPEKKEKPKQEKENKKEEKQEPKEEK